MKNKENKTEKVSKKAEQKVETTENKQLGRPVNPDSARQKRLAAMEVKRMNGDLKRGRPVKKDSARQMRIAAMAAKKAAGIEIKRGRPALPKVEKAPKVKKAKVAKTESTEAK